MNEIIKVGTKKIVITNPDKILFPKDKFTKLEIVQYYQAIAPYMVPYLKSRPITMLRYPNGISKESFYQKDTPDYFPSWIKRVKIAKEGGNLHHVVCNDAATLVYLAGQACLTPHIWLSRIDKIDYPDRMIFDFDPSKNDFSLVKSTAYIMKEFLEELGLHPFIMTTGSRGLHVVVPLKRQYEFAWVRGFARDIADYLVNQDPKHLTIEMSKAKRGKRLFIDTIRNSYAATGVAPYAIRAHPGAPVATPIEWDELKERNFDSQIYNIKNVFKRLKEHGDAWKGIDKHTQSLTAARKKLDKLK